MTTRKTKNKALKPKSSTKSRSLNADPTQAAQPVVGAPQNDQDPKRRAGRFEGPGEFTRGGVRGK